MRYNNVSCPGCGVGFAESDDIVVCPHCGTPQHRACWKEAGGCVNGSLHREGFEWKAPAQPTEEKDESAASQGLPPITCPTCGRKNPPGTKQCPGCGQKYTLFGYNVFDAYNKIEQEEQLKKSYSSQNNQGEDDNAAHAPHAEAAEGEAIDGASRDDISEYVRVNHQAYLRKFGKKKLTFNWAALLFGPYWFFYRKLIKPGIVFLTLNLLVSVVFAQPMARFSESYYTLAQQFRQAAGEAQQTEVLNKLLSLGDSFLPTMLTMLAIMLAVRLVCALLADRLYRKKVTGDIKKLRKNIQDDEAFHYAVFRLGGVSFFLVFAAIMFENVISIAASYIMGY